VIERLLAAERALEAGNLELADRLYEQVVAADPRNAIAMTGRARVAQRRGDVDAARTYVASALATDPDDAAAAELAKSIAPPTSPALAATSQGLARNGESATPGVVPSPRRSGIVGWLRRLLLGRD